ncbi:MAG TPA: hypothetical protein VNZ54_09125 [bacterium]|nr:hypothetical protein [bacterium]
MELTVRGRIALLLCLSLGLSPALPLLAADPGQAQASTGTAASVSAAEAAVADTAAANPASGTAAAAPALPDESTEGAAVPAPSGDAKEAPATLPKDKVVVPGPAKPEAPASRYKTSNFVLGFIGGALLCGFGGFLLGTNGPHGIDWAKARTIPVACALGGGILGGFGSLWLGAYTPEEARPPQVEGGLPALGLQASLRF